MSDEYTIGSDDKVARLEKRGRGFRRLITAINDLPLYGIIHATHPSLVNELELFKDKLKKLIVGTSTANLIPHSFELPF